MAKRRTRKDKLKAKHTFTFSWTPEPKKPSSTHDVKGQLEKSGKQALPVASDPKNANLLAQEASLASIKRDILKSLFLASLILGIELVVYLAWL